MNDFYGSAGDPGETPIDNERMLQKKELERLLKTAKDSERIDAIRRSLVQIESISTTKHQDCDIPHGLQSYKDQRISTQNGMRPLSSQRRRPSIQLGAIPENRTLIHQSADLERDLRPSDVSDVVASCHDPRYHPGNSMSKRGGSGSLPSFWITTGLAPHILCISFKSTWIVRRVELHALGADSVSCAFRATAGGVNTRVSGSTGAVAQQSLQSPSSIPLRQLDHRLFVLDFAEDSAISAITSQLSDILEEGAAAESSSSGRASLSSTLGSLGVSESSLMTNSPNPKQSDGFIADKVTLTFQNATEPFIVIRDLKMKIFPYTSYSR